MAFPLTTESALCSCFRILLQDLAPILRSKDLLSFWEIGPELKIFQKKISKVQDLLNNAEERSQEICVSSWMDDLRELSYDMENLVDEMNIERVRMEQQVAIRNQAGTSHHVANIRYTFMDNIADYRPHMNNVKKWVNDALARLDEVLVEANDLELKPQVARKSPVSSIASRVEAGVGASVDKSDVYGRQKDQEFVIQELLSFSHSSKNYSTISIVGMGGVGKTTLARLIFHDQRVADFDIRSWACVSDAFDSTKVVKELIEYATGENVSNMAPSALRRRLEDMLKGKKILIVLDDVWEVKAWDSLNVTFTHCAQGSKILVTTRNKNVGTCISSNECYELKTLEDEDCWTLFKGVAFGEVVDENLEKIGREIVKKCGGVPLVVKVIGSTLRFASTERWENALSNKLWQLEVVARDEIFPALKLSYHYLPSPIKRCFGYLSLFPTDYRLDQYKVVRLWIAEGFIEDREGRSWEDIGHEYYEELQRRCLIQEDDMMHDLIHSLACSVSSKFSHRLADGTGSCMHMESVRHLSVTGEDIDLGALYGNKHLRTLLLLSDHFSEKIFYQGLLRVLILRVPRRLQELPSSVQNLKYLRYLDLSMMGSSIEYLLDSICELRNLQTLDLGHCSTLRSLPNDIGNLQKLQYLYIWNASLSSLPDSICKLEKLRVLYLYSCKSFSNLPDEIGALQDLMELNLCETSISNLPKSMGKLRNLRELDIDGCHRLAQLPEEVCNLSSLERFYFDMTRVKRLPRGIGKLCNLEKLGEFVVWKVEGWGIEELNGMNKLKGPLTISHLENVDSVEKALNARLKSKMGIDSLCFKWGSLNDASDAGLATRDDGETVTKILDALEPCPNGLTTLSFVNYPGERVPTWMSKLRFPFLWRLTMDGLHCVERVMDVELPSLEFLKIENCPKLRAVSMGLPKLVRLDVSRCQELTTLGMIPPRQSYASEITHMLPSFKHRNLLLSSTIADCPALVSFLGEGLPPMLEELEIASCTSLQHLPRGLQHNTSLHSLWIRDCPELVSFPEEGLPPMLEELKIASCTSLRHLPRGLQHSTSLHLLRITDCPELVSFPEEGLPPMLEELKIASCTSLRHLSRGLQYNTSLHLLRIADCPKLVSFPEEGLPPMLQYLEIASCTVLRHLPRGLQHNTSLHLLRIADCPELVSFPEEGLPPMLQYLEIASCTGLRHLPRGLQHSTSLLSLTIKDCPELVSFPEEGLPPMLRKLKIASCTSLRHLPRGLQHSTSLHLLRIADCPELVSFPEEGLPPMLEELKIASCTSLQHLPRGLQHSTSLYLLRIADCPELVSFPEEGLPPMLEELKIASCTSLRHLPRGLQHSTSLLSLTIKDCPELVSFPEEGLPPMLRKLEIASCTSLRHLPKGLRTSLLSLMIRDCPELVSFPEEGLPPMLRKLEIVSCTSLRHLPRGLQHNTSLHSLWIKDCPALVSFREEGLPPMLQYLEIESCTGLRHLPRGLQHNTSLHLLRIRDCPELVSFPEEGLPPMLEELSISDCTNLRHLPTGLRDLTSLRFLKLDSCPVLGVSSDDQLPPGLKPKIVNCSKLEQQLKDEDRKDWLTKSFS